MDHVYLITLNTRNYDKNTGSNLI